MFKLRSESLGFAESGKKSELPITEYRPNRPVRATSKRKTRRSYHTMADSDAADKNGVLVVVVGVGPG